MSIEDQNGNTLIRVSTLWEWAFKLMIVSVPTGMTALAAFMGWLTLKVLDHDTSIAHIQGKMEALAQTALSDTASRVAAHITAPASTSTPAPSKP